MNGRYQRRRERRAATQALYAQIDSWQPAQIADTLSKIAENKTLTKSIKEYYLPLLKAINTNVPKGLQHLRELPQRISDLKNKPTSQKNSQFYFKLVGFYLFKKKLALVKDFICNYLPAKLNMLGYCDENVDIMLTGIILYDNIPKEEELPPLLDLNITQISFYKSHSKNMIPLPFEAKIAARHIASLSELSINNADQLRYFEPSQLISLTYLSAQSLKIQPAISFLSQLPSLEEINLNSPSDIHKLSDYSSLKSIKKLYITNKDCVDISFLSQLPNLVELYIHDIRLKDISVLGQPNEFSKLKILSLNVNKIVDISPLSTLHALEYLDLSLNKIEDITPLSGLKNLSKCYFGGNKLSVCPPFDFLQRIFFSDKNIQNKNNTPIDVLHPIDVLYLRPEPPHAPQIWQLLRSKDPTNTELALQIAKGLGWTNDDIEPYTHIIKKWL
jgi:hypothetical protein